MEKQMTVKDVLTETIRMIGNVSVPIALKEQIADPLVRARDNLTMCVEAIERAEKEEQAGKGRNARDIPQIPDMHVEEIGG